MVIVIFVINNYELNTLNVNCNFKHGWFQIFLSSTPFNMRTNIFYPVAAHVDLWCIKIQLTTAEAAGVYYSLVKNICAYSLQLHLFILRLRRRTYITRW